MPPSEAPPVHARARRGWGALCLVIGVLLLPTACTMTQSAFARTAGNVGSAFAAAATTLAYAHRQQLTMAYAVASFVTFKSELQGVDAGLTSMQGAPDRRVVRRLVALYRRAEPAVEHPCLARACNWQAQVATLQRASDAFVKAGGG